LRVAHEDFSDATLIVLGHGSTQNVDSAAPVYQHAAELRRRMLFAEVREAFWKQAPNVKDVLADVGAARVFIAPLFISEGYFSSRVIPRALGFLPDRLTLETRSSELIYCKPVGTHERMTGILLARARQVVAQFPFPRAPLPRNTSLFIAGHGTAQDENSRKAIERQVELIGARQEYADVHGVYLEESPRIGDCYQLARTESIVMVPFFISDGLHTREDIPILLGEPERVVRQRLAGGQSAWRNPTARNGKRVWYTSAIGTEPGLADVILERVREVAQGVER
jgi:sirohydrochlorin cobaltochelatase